MVGYGRAPFSWPGRDAVELNDEASRAATVNPPGCSHGVGNAPVGHRRMVGGLGLFIPASMILNGAGTRPSPDAPKIVAPDGEIALLLVEGVALCSRRCGW